MPCLEIRSWTFSGLVDAFLDLSIACLLLCASTLAYSASKFLGIFGLSLPSPCDGHFDDPDSHNCWQTALVDWPSETISSVQFSVKSKFPFNSTCDRNPYPTNWQNGFFGLDDEASTSSLHEKGEVFVGSGAMYARDVKEERFDIKGKGRSSQKVRHGLRSRRKVATDIGRTSSVSSYNAFKGDAQALRQSPASVRKMVNASNEGSMVPDSSGGTALKYGRDSSMEFGLLGRESTEFEAKEPVNENKPAEKIASPGDDLKFNAKGELPFGPDENKAIRVLEQALKAEQSSRDALYLELEKERSAAAIAADAALAMILRLQEEKASIEMEARQYRRMIEAKSAYAFAEMNILKDMLLRREREKHFLEKEVEAYRHLFLGSEQLNYDAQDTGTSHGKKASSLHLDEDPLQRIGGRICKKENLVHTLALGEELPIPKLNEVFPQERENQLQSDLSNAEGCNFHEKTVASVGEVQERSDIISTNGVKTIPNVDETENIFPYDSYDSKKQDQDSSNAMLNMVSHVHDVHMIDGPAVSSSQNEKDISKSCSDINSGLPMASVFGRNSMSAVDFEKLKIDNEVGRLWKKLRVVQNGRGKLNISMEETIQLQVSENILSQLGEIQQLQESGKSARQVSLPSSAYYVKEKALAKCFFRSA